MLLKLWFLEYVSQDCSEVKSPALPSSAGTKNRKTKLKLQNCTAITHCTSVSLLASFPRLLSS